MGVAVTSGSDSGQGLGFNPYVCCGGHGGGGTTFKPDSGKARGAKSPARPRGARRPRR